jgi:hypothetical protein
VTGDRHHREIVQTVLDQLRQQVNALALNEDLHAMLRQEQDWLARAPLAVVEVRSFREQDTLLNSLLSVHG